MNTPSQLGLIGGLGRMAGADVHVRLLRRLAESGETDRHNVLFEQAPRTPNTAQDLGKRKLYVHDMAERLRRRGATNLLLPCFISHTFLDELQPETPLPFISMMEALVAHCRTILPGPTVVGVLASETVRQTHLFERHLAPYGHAIRFPRAAIQSGCVVPAIYGETGLQQCGPGAAPIELLRIACTDLLDQGAEIILVGATEISMVAATLRGFGLPVVDTTEVYVEYALERYTQQPRDKVFTIGIVGGIGPAATVDFMDKLVRNTDARRDQDHLRLLVDHNPGIPDRTAHLTGNGADPTLALYAACKRLEAGGAALIAIPCNTAHAYLHSIQSGLSTPIVDMLKETIAHIAATNPGSTKVGLLATSGTVASKVYHGAADSARFELITPEPEFQMRVMEAIYGKHGVKAGHTTGQCVDDLAAAIAHLALRGAEVIILGCTELPLLLGQQKGYDANGIPVDLVDPTLILARRCIALAGGQPANLPGA